MSETEECAFAAPADPAQERLITAHRVVALKGAVKSLAKKTLKVQDLPHTKRVFLAEIRERLQLIAELESQIAQSFAAETPVTEEPKPEVSLP